MQLRSAMTLLMFMTLSSCKSIERSVPSAIIGTDDRRVVSAAGAIGYISDGTGFCSATAFSPTEVVTAAHCISSTATYSLSVNGKKFGIKSLSLSKKYDLAFLKIDGNAETWIPLSFGGISDSAPLSLVSVNRDNPSQYLVSQDGRIEGKTEGLVSHTFDTTRGTSGSPIIQDQKIVAIHLGTLPDQSRNVAATLEFKENFRLPKAFQVEACSLSTPGKCGIKDVVDVVTDAAGGVIDLGGCALASTLTTTLIAGYDSYRGNLRSRAGASRIAIPQCLYPLVAERYGFDPNWVEMWQNVSGTPSGNAITLENQIFFPIPLNPEGEPSDLGLLLHELEHVVQWKKKGKNTFLAEYVCDTGRNLSSFDQVKIHDSLNIERAADAKSNALLGYALGLCKNRSATAQRSLRSYNFPDRYVRHVDFKARIDPISTPLDRADGTFNVVPGLANNSCMSLESSNFPGYFLRHQGYQIYLHKADGTELFAADATFCQRPGRAGAGSSLEALNLPGYYLRHSGFVLFISAEGGDLAAQDSTFYFGAAL